MALKHLIAHRLTRSKPSELATIDLREHPFDINGLSEELFREMKQSALKRGGKEYGRFHDDRAEYPLASWISEWRANKLGFSSFSHLLAKQFKHELDRVEVPLEAFLFLAHETLENDEVLHIFMVQHENSLYLDGDMSLGEALHLDSHDIRLAAKINLADCLSDDAEQRAKAICLLRWRGEKELSDIFVRSVGFTDKVDLSVETEAFLGLVSEYTRELPSEVADFTQQQVVDYCLQQDSVGKPVVIEELSTQLEEKKFPKSDTAYTPPPKFTHFVEEKAPAAKPHFIADKKQLRNFVRISGRNEVLSMSFASSCLGESIVYDPNTDSLTIKNLPTTLKSRLRKLSEQK